MGKRALQILLIATFVPLCWLLMQAVHELGHIAAAFATGGTVTKVVLHPLAISRTDISGSLHPLLVAWEGPVIGVALPLALLAVVMAARLKWDYLVQFFAGTCLIANGAYIGMGSFQRVGDAGDMLRHGSPIWLLWMFGLVFVALGFWLWNGIGPKFGLGKANGQVDHAAAFASASALLIVVALEVAFSPAQ